MSVAFRPSAFFSGFLGSLGLTGMSTTLVSVSGSLSNFTVAVLFTVAMVSPSASLRAASVTSTVSVTSPSAKGASLAMFQNTVCFAASYTPPSLAEMNFTPSSSLSTILTDTAVFLWLR